MDALSQVCEFWTGEEGVANCARRGPGVHVSLDTQLGRLGKPGGLEKNLV